MVTAYYLFCCSDDMQEEVSQSVSVSANQRLIPLPVVCETQSVIYNIC